MRLWMSPLASPSTSSSSGLRVQLWRRCRISLSTAVPAAIFLVLLLLFAARQRTPEAVPHTGIDSVVWTPARGSSFHRWSTTSRFHPTSINVTADTKIEEICDSFPRDVVDSIQPILRTGYGDHEFKVTSQFSSVSICIPNLLIMSDAEETFANGKFTSLDVLEHLPSEYEVNNPDFDAYKRMQELRRNGSHEAAKKLLNSRAGWLIDRFKFMPMVEWAWELRPERKWYVFYETDTYVVWDNMFRFLDNFDPDAPLYMGSPVDLGGTYFAYGGSGFVLSRGAVRKLVARKVGRDGAFLEPSLSMRWLDVLRWDLCGDSVLRLALEAVGIKLSGYWPMFSANSVEDVAITDEHWCRPLLAFHRTQPATMSALWRWEHSRRDFKTPLLYKDLFEFGGLHKQQEKEAWDNRADIPTPGVSSQEQCKTACESEPKCMQWSWDQETCRIGHYLWLGNARRREDTDGRLMVSGWATHRLASVRTQRKCDEAEWVTASNTRIFKAGPSNVWYRNWAKLAGWEYMEEHG